MTKIAVKNSPRIVALLQCYNEMRYLEGWYENLKGRVNAIIVLDDGSNDGSSEFISHQPETTKLIINPAAKKQEWNEVENRQILINAGQKFRADWFLTIDADERLEDLFWKELEKLFILAHQEDILIFKFHLRELWNNPYQFRVDGIWGQKTKAAFFRNLGVAHVFDDRRWHGEWVPMQAWQTKHCKTIPYNLYHLKMINREDRIKRRDLYKGLDPNNMYQNIGYDYLIDESNLALQRVNVNNQYKGF